MTWNWMIFLLGAAGALAPEIVRLYKLRARARLRFRPVHAVVSLVFLGLGGLVAVIFPADTPFQAFYLGVSLPTLISALAAKPVAAARGIAPAEAAGLRAYLGALFA